MAEIRCVTAGEGRFALEAVAVLMPRGITVTAFTPGYAHLGATAQAIPRPEHDRTATVSILAVPCHRDEMPAHDIAAALATTKKLISSLEEACAPFFADTAQ